MVPGDSWSDRTGFQLQEQDFFTNREKHLAQYAADVAPILEKTYQREAKARLTFAAFETHFRDVMRSLPRLARLIFKPVVAFNLSNRPSPYWVLDFDRRTIYETQDLPENLSFRIDVPEAVLKDCIQKRMFATWTPSKRKAARPLRVPAVHRYARIRLFPAPQDAEMAVRQSLGRQVPRAWAVHRSAVDGRTHPKRRQAAQGVRRQDFSRRLTVSSLPRRPTAIERRSTSGASFLQPVRDFPMVDPRFRLIAVRRSRPETRSTMTGPLLFVSTALTLLCSLTATEVAAQAITVAPAGPVIFVGQTQQFTATGIAPPGHHGALLGRERLRPARRRNDQ